MIISLEKKSFIQAVHIASRFAGRSAATLPVLQALVLIAGNDGIKIRATNLETGIDLKVQGDKKSDGVVAIPSVVLSQIASSLSGEGTVTIEQSGDTAILSTGGARSILKTLPYEDFPNIPFPDSHKSRIVLPGVLIKSLFSSLSSCASTSSVRPELASLYLSIEGGVLTAVATDSFRLVEKKIPLKGKTSPSKFLIPAKNTLDIAQALPDEDVIVSFDDNQCAFSWEGGMVVTRLTAAVYPDYRQIIPKESIVEATVLRRDLETALKRATIFSDTFQKIKLSFEPKKKQLIIFARNADVGESTEALTANFTGNPIELSFNHRYLTSGLSLTQSESLTLSAAGVGRPLIIRGLGDATLLYLVSPMNQ